MDMQGQRALPVSQAHTWAALNDPAMLQACIPGCERFEADGEHSYVVGLSLKVGPVAAKFAGKVRLQDLQPPHAYALQFEGQGGVAGFGKGSAQVRLEATAEGCELHYTVHAQVGGKIAQLGQRLIDGAAKSLAEDFFKRFEAQLLQRHPNTNTEASAPPRAQPDKPAQLSAWAWCLGAGVVALLAALAYAYSTR